MSSIKQDVDQDAESEGASTSKSAEDRPMTVREFNAAWKARESRAAKKPAQADAPASDKSEVDPAAKKLSDLERRVRDSEDRAKQAETRVRTQSAETSFREKAGAKVSSKAMSAFVKVLKADGALSADDEGRPIIRVFDKGSSEPLEYGVEDGLKHLAKNPDYEMFFAAPTHGGSGASAVRHNISQPSYLNKPQRDWTSSEREAEYDRQAQIAEEKRQK